MNISQVTNLDSKKSNTLFLNGFLLLLKLHTINYTMITYGHFSLPSWNKNHCDENKLVKVSSTG